MIFFFNLESSTFKLVVFLVFECFCFFLFSVFKQSPKADMLIANQKGKLRDRHARASIVGQWKI